MNLEAAVGFKALFFSLPSWARASGSAARRETTDSDHRRPEEYCREHARLREITSCREAKDYTLLPSASDSPTLIQQNLAVQQC